MSSENPRKRAQDDAKRIYGARKFFASVVSTSGGLIKIKRLGESAADAQFYPAADGLAATVVADDLVVCSRVGGTIVVEYQVAVV